MFAILSFAIVVAVSAIDPITIVAYALAAYFPKTWLGVALAGTVAGIAMAGLSIALAYANYHAPVPKLLAARVVTCIIGALLLRAIGKGIKLATASADQT